MSDKPLITPTASVLTDDKTVITLATVLGAALVYAIPTLAPYSSVLVFIIAVAGLILTGHQAAEDIIAAWTEHKLAITPAPASTATPNTKTYPSGVPPAGALDPTVG